tara:strand:+ start:403 stop:642 length:240 start_codon:yes stop_codon:yes gene_type:complete
MSDVDWENIILIASEYDEPAMVLSKNNFPLLVVDVDHAMSGVDGQLSQEAEDYFNALGHLNQRVKWVKKSDQFSKQNLF